jgi:hypothetical protein
MPAIGRHSMRYTRPQIEGTRVESRHLTNVCLNQLIAYFLSAPLDLQIFLKSKE